MNNKFKNRLFAIFLVLVSTTITIALAVWIARTADIDIVTSILRIWSPRTKHNTIGIWKSDPVFDWVHIPGSSARHKVTPYFDVKYTIDKFGHRVTSGDYHSSKILFLGGSFTFGHGVEDDEHYPALLQYHLRQYKIINAAVNAWGTA